MGTVFFRERTGYSLRACFENGLQALLLVVVVVLVLDFSPGFEDEDDDENEDEQATGILKHALNQGGGQQPAGSFRARHLLL